MINTPSSTNIGRFIGSNTTTVIGFDSSETYPDVYTADFVDGVYKVNNVDSSFDDLFTFTRAGKAWLVKDTELQEYAANVPRFDAGLLIEQAATNLAVNSMDALGLLFGDNVSRIGSTGLSFANDSVAVVGSPSYNDELNGIAITFSTYTESLNIASNEYGGGSTVSAYYNGENIKRESVVSTSFDSSRYVSTRTSAGYSYTFVYPTSGLNLNIQYTGEGADLTNLQYLQLEVGLVSSYIKTTEAPVTRPADFLQTRVSGTTVTGDWDSTLNLSIVDGQLVHSGYGRIRSLEIN